MRNLPAPPPAPRRRCRWVTERAAARMAPSQLQRFQRDARGATNVEPNVQEEWLQVCCRLRGIGEGFQDRSSSRQALRAALQSKWSSGAPDRCACLVLLGSCGLISTLQVERVVARGTDEATGQPTCLVKWRGLDYDKASWHSLHAEQPCCTAHGAQPAPKQSRCPAAAPGGTWALHVQQKTA